MHLFAPFFIYICCTNVNNIIFVKEMKSYKVHILKTVSWRIIGTIDTVAIGWLLTGNPMTGIKLGGLEFITKSVLYYAHERVWFKYSKKIQ